MHAWGLQFWDQSYEVRACQVVEHNAHNDHMGLTRLYPPAHTCMHACMHACMQAAATDVATKKLLENYNGGLKPVLPTLAMRPCMGQWPMAHGPHRSGTI
jgi:hypothetical protein